MSNRVVFEVYVDDNGSLKAATKGVHGLGAEVNKTASAHKSASKEAESHFNRQEKGIIGTANSTRSFSKLRQTIGDGSGGLVGAYATLAANVFAVSAAFLALKEAAQFEQVEAGIASMGNRMGITLSLTTKKVQELSGGLLTAQQAAISTAQTMSAGFSTKDLERITVVARQASLTLGRDMTDSMDRLTRGVIKLEPELIDELGIMTRLDEASQIYARQNNKTASALTVTEKRQAFLNAALAEGELKFGAITGKDNLSNLARLGTEFQNLSKDILGVVNVIAVPLAGLFSNKGLLLGGMLLFASTISNQILPGLTHVAEKSKKAAEAASALVAEQASSVRGMGVNAKKNSKNADFANLIKDAKVGAASLERILAEQATLVDTLSIAEEKAAKKRDLEGRETIRGQEKLAIARRQQIAIVKELAIAEAAAAVARAEGEALNAGGGGFKKDFTDRLTSIGQAAQAYKAQLTATAGATIVTASSNSLLSKTILGVKTGFYAAGLSAKVFGAALLEALPIIGQIVLAATLLWEGLKFLYTSIVGKEVIAANKELEEITKSLNDKVKEREKISKSMVAASVKEQLTATLLSNSITEVADAYDKANQAQKDHAKAMARGGSPTSFGTIQMAPTVNVKDTVVADKNGMRYIEQLKELSPAVAKVADEQIALRGGMEKVNKDFSAQADIIATLKDRFTGLGGATKETAEALKEANTSAGAFIKAALPTTQYDDLAKKVGLVNSSMTRLYSESIKTGQAVDSMAAAISGVGPELEKFLKADTQSNIAEYKKQESIITELSNKKGKLADYEQDSLDNARKQLPELKAKLFLGVAELAQLQEKAVNLQVQAITMESLVKLEQARLNKLNTSAALTAGQTKERINSQNAILALQAKQIEMQSWQLKVELESIKLTRSKNEEYQKLVKTMQSANIELEVEKINNKIIANTKALASNPGTLMSALIKQENIALTHNLELIQQEKDLKAKQRVAEAGIAALQASAAALRMGMVSEEVKNAEAAVTTAKTALDTENLHTSAIEQQVAFTKSQLSLQEALGLEFNASYLIEKQRSQELLPSVIAQMKKSFDLTRAQLELEIAKTKNSGTSRENEQAAVKILEYRISLEGAISAFKIQQVENEYELNVLNAAGLINKEKTIEMEQRANSMLLDRVSILNDLSTSQTELLEMQKKLEVKKLGRDLTAAETRKLEENAATTAYKNAVAIEKIKIEGINIQYKLLAAQYTLEKIKADNASKNLEEQLKTASPANIPAIQNSILAYDTLSKALADSIAAIPQTTQAAIDLVKNDTAKAGINMESAQVGLPRLAGPDPVYFSETASLTKDSKLKDKLAAISADFQPFLEQMKSLGPDGELLSSIVSGSLIIADSIAKIGEAGISTREGLVSTLSAVSSVLTQMNSIYAASAKAKISAIDAEIAAEQKRDGKSSESVAKLAALEKKKDAAAKKAFEVNKKLSMAQVVVSTASAMMQAVGQFGPLVGGILAGVMAGMGAAQLAIIAGTSYQSSSSVSSAVGASSLTIGKRSDSVDLARNNANAGGESGYLMGSQGQGTSASNFSRAAYGGRAGVIVGEKGPEVFVPDTTGNIVANDHASKMGNSVNAAFHINAIDAQGVEEVLTRQRGHIIGMLREAANSNGQSFLENVKVAEYKAQGRKM